MTQQKIKFGKSLNPTPQQIRSGILESDLEMVNRTRRIDGIKPIGYAELVWMRIGKNAHDWMNQPFDRWAYYMLMSRYKNNYVLRINLYRI